MPGRIANTDPNLFVSRAFDGADQRLDMCGRRKLWRYVTDEVGQRFAPADDFQMFQGFGLKVRRQLFDQIEISFWR